jgi:hypothetical protein
MASVRHGQSIATGMLRRLARALGPDLLITGAADDDPSGIVTYSMAGGSHGSPGR